ncbi:hypothetical protein SLOPH_2167 [Spraguea lophii 42_110]|uniref:GATA-type domain-containing protein n=1 Tax=Spraguea lophii (strain 42_110) TaxID=1358809 RepID=S7WAL9_SPRLO|nr:hypothetical protein SLOPH_2167 [Spraguea lophii 42_110]
MAVNNDQSNDNTNKQQNIRNKLKEPSLFEAVEVVSLFLDSLLFLHCKTGYSPPRFNHMKCMELYAIKIFIKTLRANMRSVHYYENTKCMFVRLVYIIRSGNIHEICNCLYNSPKFMENVRFFMGGSYNMMNLINFMTRLRGIEKNIRYNQNTNQFNEDDIISKGTYDINKFVDEKQNSHEINISGGRYLNSYDNNNSIYENIQNLLFSHAGKRGNAPHPTKEIFSNPVENYSSKCIKKSIHEIRGRNNSQLKSTIANVKKTSYKKRKKRECFLCGAKKSPAWRILENKQVCNACGLYYKGKNKNNRGFR